MWTYTLNEIAQYCTGTVAKDNGATVSGVFTDSRIDGTGKLFVALSGDNFDGHHFVASAVANGAVAAMVSYLLNDIDIPQIVVGDTLAGLTAFATAHRQRFSRKVAAVTGSSGKTTTRSLLCAILSVKGRVHQPEKNFNNHIGVPLTALKLDDAFDAAVFELGCSDFNEIGPLTKIVDPDVAVITNVGEAHLENLKNHEGVARAKGELFLSQRTDACAIVNMDDPWIAKMQRRARQVITFSALGASADVVLQKRVPGPSEQHLTLRLIDEVVEIAFSLPGIHNAIDATAAAAAALAMGATPAEIQSGLTSAKAYLGRFNIHENNGVFVIDDTYNANPSSMAASLAVLGEMVAPEHRIAVLGDMLELGDNGESAHRHIGEIVATLKVKHLLAMGAFAQTIRHGAIDHGMAAENITCCDSVDKIVKKVLEISNSGDALLIKGSRGMKMERVVRAILEG